MEGAVGALLVGAHDPDRLEAHLLVGADGALVGERRVDAQPVVAAVLEEVTRDGTQHVGAQALPHAGDVQRYVDAGVLVVRVALLGVHDEADELAVELDRERGGLVGVTEGVGAQALHVVAGPPLGDAGLQQDLEQAREVGLSELAEGDALAVEDWVRHRYSARMRLLRGLCSTSASPSASSSGGMYIPNRPRSPFLSAVPPAHRDCPPSAPTPRRSPRRPASARPRCREVPSRRAP